MLSALFHPSLAVAGFGAAFAVYLGFPLGRIAGIEVVRIVNELRDQRKAGS